MKIKLLLSDKKYYFQIGRNLYWKTTQYEYLEYRIKNFN